MMIGRRRLLLLMALLMSVWNRAWSQMCTSQITCGDCIGQAGCAWCFAGSFMSDTMRCQPVGNLTTAACPANNIANPGSTFGERILAPPPSGGAINPPIDVSEVRLNLRVGDPQDFTVSVTPQRNLPLDFYILIDLSRSMLDEINTIKAISTLIAQRIEGITNNVRLGVGAFNEKVTHPFARQSLDPATDPIDPSTFAFRHFVSLTDDIDEFSTQVNSLNLTTNADFPENGLEGLAQVITCEEIIGWRDRGANAVGTRLVLFMTDEEYHYAGEGRLAGILKPYDGTCLLERDSPGPGPAEFTRFLEFDYPSVGQILELLRQFDVTTIFAIQDDHLASYESLVSEILNANSVRAVTQNFTINQATVGNVAEQQILGLIENEYTRLLQAVSLDVTSVSQAISVEVTPSCPTEAGARVMGNACVMVPLQETVNFTITATLNSCENLNDGGIINSTIFSPSFGSFNLSVTVTCDCECAREGVRTDQDCSGMGVRRCAVCECDEGRCGSDCSRLIGNRTSLDCPRGRTVDGVENAICSGRGQCDCVCICDQPDAIFGPACECDTSRCPNTGVNGADEVCSGMERGLCCDGRCRCLNSTLGNPYRGNTTVNNCQCEPLEEVCIDPNTNTLCNGRGTCGCQFCDCDDPQYRGIFCEIEIDGLCGNTEDMQCIAQCRASFETEEQLPDVCTHMCTRTRPILFVDTEDLMAADQNSQRLTMFLEDTANTLLADDGPGTFTYLRGPCTYVDVENGLCQVDYYILENVTHIAIVAERMRMCVDAGSIFLIPVYAVALIILGSLLLLGVLLLILIKIIFLILDYIEVKKWQKDAQTADFSKNTNPLYQSPEMKYENVAYGRE